MKKLLYLLIAAAFTAGGCTSDKSFLEEIPTDRLSLDNAYLNYAQFKTGLNELYRQVRLNYNNRDNGEDYFHFGTGTDNQFVSTTDNARFTDWTLVNPTSGIFYDVYTRHYFIINQANNILEQTNNARVSLTEAENSLFVQRLAFSEPTRTGIFRFYLAV